MTVTTIDFRKLLQEEKRRYRYDHRLNETHASLAEASDQCILPEGICRHEPIPKPAPEHSPLRNTAASEANANSNALTLATVDAYAPEPPPLPLDLVTLSEHPPLLRFQSAFVLACDYSADLVRRLLADLPSQQQQPFSSLVQWTYLPHARRHVAQISVHPEMNPVDSHGPMLRLRIRLCRLFTPLLRAVSPLFPMTHPPNHILLNHYASDQLGILPHTDGPAYYPLTCTISWGAAIVLHFQPSQSKPTTTGGVAVPPSSSSKSTLNVVVPGKGSLLVFSSDLYSDYLHSIDEQPPDTEVFSGLLGLEHDVNDAGATAAGSDDWVTSGRLSITIRHKYDVTKIISTTET